ncbi:MAG: glycerol uptake operon antiterminator [Thermotogaceae bacterium]|jgi:glycerol uptake operon antiterminator|nr:glycerol uptake operon antiterminator [Thermotogaceae bacterium]
MKSLFLLQGSINTLPRILKKIKSVGGVLFVDVDFISGLQADDEGILFLKKQGVNGIITTKPRLVKLARDMNLSVVLRFFAIDSHAVERGAEQIRNYSPDFVEILPGIAAVRVIKKLNTSSQIIAAGLLDNEEDVREIFKKGINHISTSSAEIWNLYRSRKL